MQKKCYELKKSNTEYTYPPKGVNMKYTLEETFGYFADVEGRDGEIDLDGVNCTHHRHKDRAGS